VRSRSLAADALELNTVQSTDLRGLGSIQWRFSSLEPGSDLRDSGGQGLEVLRKLITPARLSRLLPQTKCEFSNIDRIHCGSSQFERTAGEEW
jgi:hypothetical protein